MKINNAKFNKGDIVEIISECNSKGSLGTVVGYSNPYHSGFQYVVVELKNGSIYKYSPTNLKMISTSKYNEENETELNNFKVATIKFLEGTNTNKTYYYALYDAMSVGDKVVVKSGHHGFGIAEIVNIENENHNKVEYGREIICYIDFSSYEGRINKSKRLAHIKAQMNEKVKEIQKNAIYEILAEKDESLRSLLDEYKSLSEA